MESETNVPAFARGISSANGVPKQLHVSGEEITLEKMNGSLAGFECLGSIGNAEVNDGVIVSSIEEVTNDSSSLAGSIDMKVSKVPELKETDQLKTLRPKIQAKPKNEKPSTLVKKVSNPIVVASYPFNGSLGNTGLKKCSAGEKNQITNPKSGVRSNSKPSPAVYNPHIAKQSRIAMKSDGQKEKTKLKPLGNASINQAEENTESNLPTAVDAKSLRIGALPAYNFSFKCNERAEKRREFYSKLEDKINAKKAENSNLQAKSKECQEAELKMLRKSLTFKATPMPSFYQEPVPPKAGLKKIPTTTAKSPKFGRKKGSSRRDSDGYGHQSVQLSFDEKSLQNNENKASPTYVKKPQRKSLPKLPSEKTILFKEANDVALQKVSLLTDTNEAINEICIIEEMGNNTISAKISLTEFERDDIKVVEDQCLVALVPDQNYEDLGEETVAFQNPFWRVNPVKFDIYGSKDMKNI